MNPPPIPKEFLPPLTSFHHKAANFAVIVLPVSIGLSLMLNQITGFLPPFLRFAVSLLPAIVMISAVPAGIIALCGIPRHGMKKLLWKGLVGVIIPLFLTVSAMMLANSLRQKAQERSAMPQVIEGRSSFEYEP